MKLAIASLFTLASAYVAPPAAPAAARLASSVLDDLEGDQKPLGNWDPLNLAETSDFGPTLAWYRACELKHGRVAMAAFVGFIVNGLGVCWPGEVAPGVTWKSCMGATPFDTWDNLPMYGKYQIIAYIGLMEGLTEMQKPHYLVPGGDGRNGEVFFNPVKKDLSLWDPIGSMAKWSEEKKAHGRLSELQNGRAAMFGIMGFVYAYKGDGYVPGLDFLPDYTGGLPGQPFAADWNLAEMGGPW